MCFSFSGESMRYSPGVRVMLCVWGGGQWWWLELSVHLDTPPSPSLQLSQEDLCPSSLPGAIGGMGRPGGGE